MTVFTSEPLFKAKSQWLHEKNVNFTELIYLTFFSINILFIKEKNDLCELLPFGIFPAFCSGRMEMRLLSDLKCTRNQVISFNCGFPEQNYFSLLFFGTEMQMLMLQARYQSIIWSRVVSIFGNLNRFRSFRVIFQTRISNVLFAGWLIAWKYSDLLKVIQSKWRPIKKATTQNTVKWNVKNDNFKRLFAFLFINWTFQWSANQFESERKNVWFKNIKMQYSMLRNTWVGSKKYFK